MNALLPAVLAGCGAAVVVGLPVPRRRVLASPPAAAGRPRGRLSGLLPLVVGLAALLPLGPVGAAVAVVLTSVARRALVARAATTARAAERAGAAEALAVLAAELRAGRTPEDALDRASCVAVGPARTGFASAAAASRVGGFPHEVLATTAHDSAVGDMLRGLSACWRVCQGTGSSLAAAVDRLEEAMHEEAVRRDLLQSELAGPRATATLLAALPGVGLLMAAGLGAHPLHVLLHTPVGAACLAVGIGLDLVGMWWTGRIVAAAGGAE